MLHWLSEVFSHTVISNWRRTCDCSEEDGAGLSNLCFNGGW